MARIEITHNQAIDEATAEIAVALRDACRVTCTAQDHYDEAQRLRDAIMAGTRELDHQAALAGVKDGMHPAFRPTFVQHGTRTGRFGHDGERWYGDAHDLDGPVA